MRFGTGLVAGLFVLLTSVAIAGEAEELSQPEGALDSQEYSDLVNESVAIVTPPDAMDELVGPPKPLDTKRADKRSKKPRIAENVDLSEPVVPVPEFDLEFDKIPAPETPTVRKYSQPSLFILDTEVSASTSARRAPRPRRP